MNDTQRGAAELRRVAEERALAEKRPGDTPKLEETHRLIHELRVHQIELEMQNDELRRAQREIETSRARYFDLYDFAPVAYLTINKNGSILESNLTAARLLDVERITFPRQHLPRFVVKEYQDIYYRFVKRLFETGSPQGCELKLNTGAEVILDVRLEATIAVNGDGNRVARIILVDITERRRAEAALHESEARLRAISEAAFDGIIIHGDGEIIEVNEAFGNIYGYAVSELIGTPLLDLYVQESHDIIRHHVDGGLETPYEVTAIRKDGSKFLVEVRGRNAVYKEKKVRAGTHRDITERRRAEEELKVSREALRLANEDLEEKVKRRSQKLIKAVAKLEEEIEQRSRVEQELNRRALQLRALAGELTMVEQRERKRISNVLHDHVQQMMAAVKLQVGSLYGVDSGNLRHTVESIESILGEAILITRSLSAELSPPILHEGGLKAGFKWLARWMLQKHGLTVEIVSPKDYFPLTEDVRVLLFEATRELLFNAVKHSGVLKVKVSLIDDGSFLNIAVTDDGRGFDPSNQIKTGDEGAGFGLFSIRERLELIGGEFTIDSAFGKGTRVTLTAPLTAAGSQVAIKVFPHTTDHPVEGSPGKIRLLLADDHPVMREGLARLLGQEPDIHIVAEANNGLEAVKLAEQFLPDVVLMDFSMPVLNGIEATKAIKQRHPEIQVIGLSVYDQDERAKEMLDAGAVNYLTKTGPAAAVKAAIRACKKGVPKNPA